jgi:hypothetical protein
MTQAKTGRSMKKFDIYGSFAPIDFVLASRTP